MLTDRQGFAYFAHCRSPYTVNSFCNQLKTLIPEINRGIYLEGGAELLADARAAGVLNYGFWYQSPLLGGAGWGGAAPWGEWAESTTETFGADTLRRGSLQPVRL